MFLDEKLFEKIKTTELKSGKDAYALLYSLYEIAVNHVGGDFKTGDEFITIEITDIDRKKIINSWRLFTKELEKINPSLANFLYRNAMNDILNPKIKK